MTAARYAAGTALPAADAAGLKVVGRAEDTVDNRDGLVGDLSINVRRGVFLLPNSATDPVDPNDVGNPCYIESDEAVREAGGDNDFFAGLVDEGVWVDTATAIALQAAAAITAAAIAANP